MSDFLSYFPEVEQQYGLPTGYLERVAQVESRMDPTAQNPNSSAGGLFQFVDRTARQYNLTDRFDPRQATDAAARLARDNAATLRNVLGRDPTAGELYLAHQQGAGGAARLLRNPDAPAVGVLGNEAFRLNGGRPGMTAAQFAQRWIGKIDGRAPTASTTQGPPRGAMLPNITPQDAETWAEAPPQAMGYAPANLTGMPRGTPTVPMPPSRPQGGIQAMAQNVQQPGALPPSPLTPPTQGSTMASEQTAEKPVPATIGGLGGLGGFQPLAGGKFGDMLQMIGMALLSSPGNAPLQNLPALAMTMQQSRTAAEERERQRAKDERDFAFRQQEAARQGSQFDRSLALQERGLNRREAVQLTPIKDNAGNVIGSYNPITGETLPVRGPTPPNTTAPPASDAAAPAAPPTDAPAVPAAPGGPVASPGPQSSAQRLGPTGIPIIQSAPKLVTIKNRETGQDETVEQLPDGTLRRPTVQGDRPSSGNPYATGSFNDTQGKAAGFADRMFEAERILQRTEPAMLSTPDRLLSGIPIVGNRMVSNDFQQGEQAQRTFINAVLRRESGAVISPSEFENARRQYFPQPGDSPETLAQKRAARRQAIAGMAREGGPSYRPGMTFDDRGNIVERQQQEQQRQQSSGNVPRINSPQEYQALRSGDEFIAPDGTRRRKP